MSKNTGKLSIFDNTLEQLQLLEEKRRMLHDELTKSLEAKNKLEAKELTQRKNIDMATSDLKLKSLRLNIIQKHLRQLSDQLKMKKSTLIGKRNF